LKNINKFYTFIGTPIASIFSVERKKYRRFRMIQKNKDLIEALNKEIETRILPKTNYPYIPASAVRGRLNDVFGCLWNTEIVSQDVIDNDIVLLKLRLIAKTDDQEEIIKEAFGSSTIQRYSGGNNKGKPVDLGDAYNNAVTDAIKSCAKQLGIGNTQLDVKKDISTGMYVQVSDNEGEKTNVKIEQTEQPTKKEVEQPVKKETTITSQEKIIELKRKLAERKGNIKTQDKLKTETVVEKEDEEDSVKETIDHGFDYSGVEDKEDSPKNTQKLVILNLAKMQKMNIEDYIKKIIGVSKTVDELTSKEAGQIVRSGFTTALNV